MDLDKIYIGQRVIPIGKPLWGSIEGGDTGREYLFVRSIFKEEDSYHPFWLKDYPAIECMKYRIKYAHSIVFKPEDLVPYMDGNERKFYGKGILERS
jgi:hypothetical protein